MREINMAASYSVENLIRDDVLDPDAKANLRKLYNLGVGNEFLETFKSYDSDVHELFQGSSLETGRRYLEKSTFSKKNLEDFLIDLADYDKVMKDLGITKEDFENASAELPEEHGGEILLWETVKSDKLDKFFEFHDLDVYNQVRHLGLTQELADTLIMYCGDRISSYEMGIGDQFGPNIRYEHIDDRIAEGIVVRADVAADFMRNELARTLFPEVGISKPEYESDIPGLTEVLRTVNYYNLKDMSLNAINNLYEHYDPERIPLGSVDFSDTEQHYHTNVSLTIEAQEGTGYFKLHASAYGIPFQTVEFENAYDLINAIDDIETDASKVLDVNLVRKVNEMADERTPVVRMEDNADGVIPRKLRAQQHKIDRLGTEPEKVKVLADKKSKSKDVGIE